jgi:hypothetical protein
MVCEIDDFLPTKIIKKTLFHLFAKKKEGKKIRMLILFAQPRHISNKFSNFAH